VAIEDAMRFMGEWTGLESPLIIGKKTSGTAAETASICVARSRATKMQLRLFGADPGVKETWRLAQGSNWSGNLPRRWLAVHSKGIRRAAAGARIESPSRPTGS